jgi:serine O-acetyltransferase
MFGTLCEDIQTVFARDPAARTWWEVLTCYPGLHAVWLHRIAHVLWRAGLTWPARALSHLSRFATGIEIHPGAKLGRRCFIDHGMGIVIGETAEIGDDVLLYKGVVLGGISLTHGKRHPTIGAHVVLGTNAVVLGPISIGDRSRIGSGAVVIKPVPADSTAVGVPARVVRGPHVESSPDTALQHDRLPDPVAEACRVLAERIDSLERQLRELRAEPANAILDSGDHDDGS